MRLQPFVRHYKAGALGTPRPAKPERHGRPACKYPDDQVLAVLVDWLRGVKRAEILRKHDVSETALTNWTTHGNRRHLLLQAERLVPLHERARGNR